MKRIRENRKLAPGELPREKKEIFSNAEINKTRNSTKLAILATLAITAAAGTAAYHADDIKKWNTKNTQAATDQMREGYITIANNNIAREEASMEGAGSPSHNNALSAKNIDLHEVPGIVLDLGDKKELSVSLGKNPIIPDDIKAYNISYTEDKIPKKSFLMEKGVDDNYNLTFDKSDIKDPQLLIDLMIKFIKDPTSLHKSQKKALTLLLSDKEIPDSLQIKDKYEVINTNFDDMYFNVTNLDNNDKKKIILSISNIDFNYTFNGERVQGGGSRENNLIMYLINYDDIDDQSRWKIEQELYDLMKQKVNSAQRPQLKSNRSIQNTIPPNSANYKAYIPKNFQQRRS